MQLQMTLLSGSLFDGNVNGPAFGGFWVFLFELNVSFELKESKLRFVNLN